MTYTAEGGTKFTVSNGSIVPVKLKSLIDASLAANPQASTGAYMGPPMPPQYKGDTGSTETTESDPTDYSTFLGIYNLPADVQSKVNEIFGKTGDVNQATALAMAYIRGTPWYTQTYPGIQEGIARGVISNEADYRNYLSNVNVLSHQYLGRDVSGDELAGYLHQGFSPDRIGRIYQGGALVKTYGGDWNYASGAFDENGRFTAEESAALGQEQAGIDTVLGQKVKRRLDLAQQRLAGVFSGTAATPSLSLAGGRLSAPSLGGGAASDVAA